MSSATALSALTGSPSTSGSRQKYVSVNNSTSLKGFTAPKLSPVLTECPQAAVDATSAFPGGKRLVCVPKPSSLETREVGRVQRHLQTAGGCLESGPRTSELSPAHTHQAFDTASYSMGGWQGYAPFPAWLAQQGARAELRDSVSPNSHHPLYKAAAV